MRGLRDKAERDRRAIAAHGRPVRVAAGRLAAEVAAVAEIALVVAEAVAAEIVLATKRRQREGGEMTRNGSLRRQGSHPYRGYSA